MLKLLCSMPTFSFMQFHLCFRFVCPCALMGYHSLLFCSCRSLFRLHISFLITPNFFLYISTFTTIFRYSMHCIREQSIEMENLKSIPSRLSWLCRRRLVPWQHWPCFSASPSRIASLFFFFFFFFSVTLSYLSVLWIHKFKCWWRRVYLYGKVRGMTW